MAEAIQVRRDELKRLTPPPRPTPKRGQSAPSRPTHRTAHKPVYMEFLPMSIISRTRDIIAANVTDLLDRAEDPAKMIRMIVVEMEESLVELRASAARAAADRQEIERQVARLEQLQSDWEEKAELALAKDRDDLARAALSQKQLAAETADELRAECSVLEDEVRAMENDTARLQAKLREARERQGAILARVKAAARDARLRDERLPSRVDDSFSRFEMLERRAALGLVDDEALAIAGPKSLDEEFAVLRNADKIEAELAALKAKRG